MRHGRRVVEGRHNRKGPVDRGTDRKRPSVLSPSPSFESGLEEPELCLLFRNRLYCVDIE